MGCTVMETIEEGKGGWKVSQNKEILYWLKRRSITPMDAMVVLNVYRLAARISDLRAQGWNIVTELEKHENGKHARYYLRDSK